MNIWWFMIFIVILIILWYIIKTVIEKLVLFPCRQCSDIIGEEFKIEGIHGYYCDYSYRKTIIYAHGNAGNIYDRQYMNEWAKRLQCNLVVFDYPGFGKSDGNSSISNCYKAADIVYDYVISHYKLKPNNIILWGESLGGGVMSYLAEKHKVNGLILMATFTSLINVIRDSFTSFGYLVHIFIDPMDTYSRLPYISCPILFIHSQSDQLIPYHHSVSNFNSVSNKSKHFITVTGNHSNPHITKSVLSQIKTFFT